MPQQDPELVRQERLDLRDSSQVELWTSTLSIYVVDLVEAVHAVGDRTIDVLPFIREKIRLRRGPRKPG